MNRKILTLAVAATLAGPTAVSADIKVSGTIQAEAASWEAASDIDNVTISGYDDSDRQTLTNDAAGALFNEGPNVLAFDIEEKLGSGISAFARYSAGFNTSGNGGLDQASDAWLGLKTRNFYFKYGTLAGAYGSSRSLLDPWAFTSLQATGTGGGMSGIAHHHVFTEAERDASQWFPDGFTQQQIEEVKNNPVFQRAIRTPIAAIDPIATDPNAALGLSNEGFINGALELGVKFGGFTARLQGVVDDTSELDGAGLLELRYTAPNFSMWLSGSFTDLEEGLEEIKDEATADLDDALGDLNETIGRTDAATEARENAVKARTQSQEADANNYSNWKIGGKFNLGPKVELGLQYEQAEMGTFDWDVNPDGGKYILGSLAVNMSNVTLAGWVSGYLSDIDDQDKLIDANGDMIDEDALSWALGAKYHFSKRAQVYLGYRQTDSDNDYRDENIIVLGIRHNF
jgi:predicted porin